MFLLRRASAGGGSRTHKQQLKKWRRRVKLKAKNFNFFENIWRWQTFTNFLFGDSYKNIFTPSNEIGFVPVSAWFFGKTSIFGAIFLNVKISFGCEDPSQITVTFSKNTKFHYKWKVFWEFCFYFCQRQHWLFFFFVIKMAHYWKEKMSKNCFLFWGSIPWNDVIFTVLLK